MHRKLLRKAKTILHGRDPKIIGKVLLLVVVALYVGSYFPAKHLVTLYNEQASGIIQDRNGIEIQILPNAKGQFMRPAKAVPEQFHDLLIAKEDRFFFYHLGINPISIIRSFLDYPFTRRFDGSSTLTQQLVKNILGNENKRNIKNKIIESFYAVSLELHSGKSEILKMYADTAYFGNQAEGITEAALTYYNLPPESLNITQTLELISALSNPGDFPGTAGNKLRTAALGKRLGISYDEKAIGVKPVNYSDNPYQRKNIDMFELTALKSNCVKPCSLTIDQLLTDTIRKILQTNLDSPVFASVQNGAVVVIRLNKDADENELLAIIGSPHPTLNLPGYQINMAVRPRPIGSTAKPFFYAKAFEKGARPYTEVEDREYRFDIGTGFAIYPKNYDGKYRGTVTLHEALSNSLNVPAVRTLQYVGLDNFYDFLQNDLFFKPLQPLNTYELSIALGGLEMDMLTLTNYFSLFPNQGILKPLRVSTNDVIALPMAEPYKAHKVIEPEYTQLITKILSDRATGVDQFGLKGNLNLPATNYAVKTGTSYDYHDSWTVGYTPDFLVGVWLGNSDNKPMYRFSGSIGAGKIWHEVMQTLLASDYNSGTDFDLSRVKEYLDSGSLDYGLKGDNYQLTRNLMEETDLILQPHNLDVLEFSSGMKVPLRASEISTWYVSGLNIGRGTDINWEPLKAGIYSISAKSVAGKKDVVKVTVNDEDR